MAEQKFELKKTRTIKNLDNKIWKYDIHPWVFFGGAGLIIFGVVFVILAGEFAQSLFTSIKSWICTYTGWFMVLTMNVLLGTCIAIGVSKYGRLRIGGADAEPEFSTAGWFAMLFSAARRRYTPWCAKAWRRTCPKCMLFCTDSSGSPGNWSS